MKTISCFSITKTKSHYSLLLLFMVSCFLTGCEKSNQHAAAIKQDIKKYDLATTLEGRVSYNHGLVKSGTIKVTDTHDELVASTALQNNGHYSVKIPRDTVLPIVLTFYPEASEGQKLITPVVHPGITKYDINPLTTSIAKKAQAMGGYTHANLVRAAEETVTVPDANKTTAGFRGDPTMQYGGWH